MHHRESIQQERIEWWLVAVKSVWIHLNNQSIASTRGVVSLVHRKGAFGEHCQ